MLRVELYKATHNWRYVFSILIGIVICVAYAFWSHDFLCGIVGSADADGAILFTLKDISFVDAWLGHDVISACGRIFYISLFPILAAYPYATALLQELKSGYYNVVITRSGRRKYYVTKYIATFLSGGIVVTIPAVLSLLVALTWLPNIPEMRELYMTGVTMRSMWSDIFFSKPLLYCLMYIALDFVVAGIIACLSITISLKAKDGFVSLIFPMILFSVLYDLLGYFNNLRDIRQLIPNSYVSPAAFDNVTFKSVLISLLCLSGFIVVALAFRLHKNEIE